jgi:hypothetical protein
MDYEVVVEDEGEDKGEEEEGDAGEDDVGVDHRGGSPWTGQDAAFVVPRQG